MADKNNQGQRNARVRDVEALAATIYVQFAINAGTRGKTPQSLAEESLRLARVFYRACDEPAAELNASADKAAA